MPLFCSAGASSLLGTLAWSLGCRKRHREHPDRASLSMNMLLSPHLGRRQDTCQRREHCQRARSAVGGYCPNTLPKCRGSIRAFQSMYERASSAGKGTGPEGCQDQV